MSSDTHTSTRKDDHRAIALTGNTSEYELSDPDRQAAEDALRALPDHPALGAARAHLQAATEGRPTRFPGDGEDAEEGDAKIEKALIETHDEIVAIRKRDPGDRSPGTLHAWRRRSAICRTSTS